MNHKNKNVIYIIITISGVMKIHTGVNCVVDVFIKITLEFVDIMNVFFIKISELPMIVKG